MERKDNAGYTPTQVTVFRSPKPVVKSFNLDADGKVVKTAGAQITQAEALTKQVATLEDMAGLLRIYSERVDCCLILDHFDGAPKGMFSIVPEAMLAKMLRQAHKLERAIMPAELTGMHQINGGTFAARLKRSVSPSGYMLIDADNPPGMPDELKCLDLQQRLERLEKLVPGISACGRVEMRSSSSRVRKVDEPPRGPSHAYIRVIGDIELLRLHIDANAPSAGLGFPSPRYDRTTHEQIGSAWRTIIDTAVLINGRIVFCGKPLVHFHVINAGYALDDADVRVLEGPPLDISWLKPPNEAVLIRHARITGTRMSVSTSGNLVTRVRGMLDETTPIESRKVIKPFGEWLKTMVEGRRKRCEAPFRESHSEAAFIRKHEDGGASVHDVGNNTTYIWLGPYREEIGVPGSKMVIAANHADAMRGMQVAGIDFATISALYMGNIWVEPGVEEVVIVKPRKTDGFDTAEMLVERLRAGRINARIIEGA